MVGPQAGSVFSAVPAPSGLAQPGTPTAISTNHELSKSLNVEGIQYLLDEDGNPFMDNTEGVGGFMDLPLRGQKNLDLGGGSFDSTTTWLWLNRGVRNYVHDTYARSATHNKGIEKEMFDGRSPSVTSISVLNVIPSKEERREHIQTAFDALIPGGQAFFKVYKGDGTRVAGQKEDEGFFQHNQPAGYFLAEIQEVFQHQGGHAELFEASNLITATKAA